MKNLLKIVLCGALFVVVTSFVDVQKKEKAKPIVKARLMTESKWNIDSTNILEMKINLYNTSEDTMFYIVNNPIICQFITNTSKLKVRHFMGNVTCNLWKVGLSPHDSTNSIDLILVWSDSTLSEDNQDQNFRLTKNEMHSLLGLRFKIGFQYCTIDSIKMDELNSEREIRLSVSKRADEIYSQLNDKDNIIWSNEVEITKHLPIISEH